MRASGDETRELLLHIIQNKPGITKSRLQQEASLAWGTISYHVRILQRDGRIDAFRLGRTLRLAPRRFSKELEQEAALMAPLARDIIQAISTAGTRGTADLARATGQSARRVDNQLGYLMDAGLIDRTDAYHPRYELNSKGMATAQKLGANHPPPNSDQSATQQNPAVNEPNGAHNHENNHHSPSHHP